MRARHGNSSPWSDDDASNSALTTVFEDAPHFRGRRPQPPPPPPPAPTDPNSYYTGVESGVVWTASLTTTSTDSSNNLQLIFSFPDSASDFGRRYSETSKFVPFNEIESDRFSDVIDQVNGYLSRLNLVENTTVGASDGIADIRIGKTVTTGADAWAYYPAANKGGDAWFNRNDSGAVFGGKGGMNWNPAHLTPGDYTYTVLMHEFGHSLGLKHSFESGGVAGAVPHAFDSLEYTLMSYDAYQTTPYSSTVDQREWWADDGNNPTTFMMLDIAALQQMYGADYNTNAGDTVYDVHNPADIARTSAGKIFMTLWDGGGNDTYDLSDYSVSVSIDLQPGHWVTIDSTSERADLLAGDGERWATGNIANAVVIPGVNNDGTHADSGYIENAIGGNGNDVLIGNVKANVLTGGAGNDTLTGLAGNDTFVFDSLIGLDTLTDFISGQDKLEFASSIFSKLTPVGGTLDSGEFAIASPSDPNDFIIYNPTTGALSYDSDGKGNDSAIQVAVLGTGAHPSLNYSDILIA